MQTTPAIERANIMRYIGVYSQGFGTPDIVMGAENESMQSILEGLQEDICTDITAHDVEWYEVGPKLKIQVIPQQILPASDVSE